MTMYKLFHSVPSAATLAALLLAGMWPSDANADYPSFKELVYPIFETYCLDCHQPDGTGLWKVGSI